MPGGGDLVFCSHHAKQYDEHLRKIAVRIIDQSPAGGSDGSGAGRS